MQIPKMIAADNYFQVKTLCGQGQGILVIYLLEECKPSYSEPYTCYWVYKSNSQRLRGFLHESKPSDNQSSGLNDEV